MHEIPWISIIIIIIIIINNGLFQHSSPPKAELQIVCTIKYKMPYKLNRLRE